jgi:hypothetical protein
MSGNESGRRKRRRFSRNRSGRRRRRRLSGK